MNKLYLLSLLLICTISFGCATGSVIITGNTRPAISPNEVRLLLDPPQKYETIGIVEASSAVEFSNQAAQDRAIKELKKQASKIGANGIILLDTSNKKGDTVGVVTGNMYYASTEDRKTVRGRAIFIIKE